jgi:hypothetical protein
MHRYVVKSSYRIVGESQSMVNDLNPRNETVANSSIQCSPIGSKLKSTAIVEARPGGGWLTETPEFAEDIALRLKQQ